MEKDKQRYNRLSAIALIGILTILTAVLSFFDLANFDKAFYGIVWMIVLGKCLSTAILVKKARLIHILFVLFVLSLAAERSFNHIEYVQVGFDRPVESKILGEDIRLKYFRMPRPMDNNYHSKLEVLSGNGESSGILKASVNHPVRYKNVLIYQYAYNSRPKFSNVYLIRTTKFVLPMIIFGLLTMIALFAYYINKSRRKLT